MFWNRQPDVLVAGAGPVGLAVSIMLVEQQLSVDVIDERFESSISGMPDYSFLLHPSTLAMLDDLGIGSDLIRSGARIDRVVVYDHTTPVATARFADLPVRFPFALSIGHHDLVRALSARLRAHGRKVGIARRLAGVEQGDERAVATIEKLGVDSGGFSVDGPLFVIEKTMEKRPRFVVGADGWHSRARRCANVSLNAAGTPRSYAILELESETALDGEARIIVGDDGVDALWPLPNGQCRWTFQISAGDVDSLREDSGRFDRERVDVPGELVHRMIRDRAPWFRDGSSIGEPALHVRVDPAFAQCFGLGRIWLAGDAAHVANPIGAHSLNSGLLEAQLLARALSGAMRGTESAAALYDYDESRCAEWQGLFGTHAADFWGLEETAWGPQTAADIVACLPATGQGLVDLSAQIGIHLPPARAH